MKTAADLLDKLDREACELPWSYHNKNALEQASPILAEFLFKYESNFTLDSFICLSLVNF